ncbi:hypothetical protein Q5530_31535 [Saccharothrix sp. BKS2]|uniref:hypothetical protein n=1 Tax=Saccharothrix sp. BKS2 TaxID=3064400 RepID=UPI0039E7A6F0
MARADKPLNPHQVEVLGWVADGCPDGVWPGQQHKVSARALQARRLLSVNRLDGRWHATLTPAGRYYLDHGSYPSPGAPLPAPVVKPRTRLTASATSTPASTKKTAATGKAAVTTPTPSQSAADELVAAVLAAGGTLAVDIRNEGDDRSFTAKANAIRRGYRLPAGKQLLVRHNGWKHRILSIVDLPDWMAPPVAPVQVPERLRNPHPAIVALRDSERALPVVGLARARALRLLHALAATAQERGHKVKAVTDDGYRRRDDVHQLVFHIHGHQVRLRITQLNDRADHVPTAKELADKRRWPNTSYIPKYDYTPSHRLRIEIPGRHEYYRSAWSDGTGIHLDDHLPEILRELEHRADGAHRAEQEEQERRHLQEIQRQQRLARAKVMLVESHRADTLHKQLDAWTRARQLDVYLDAMQARIDTLDDLDQATAAREWLNWARDYAHRTNPLNHPIAMPADPEPTLEALAPFLPRADHYLR